MCEGRSVIEELTGQEAQDAEEAEQAFVNVKISKNAYAQISKLAKKRKKGVGEIIEERFVDERA
jgi:hypothetical protein